MTQTTAQPTGGQELAPERVQQMKQPRRPRRGLGFPGLLMAPAVIFMAGLSIIPFLTLIGMSFSRVRLLGGAALEWRGLDNWARALTDPNLWTSWATTVLYFVVTVGLELLIGIGVAVALHRVLRGRGLVLSLVLLPMFVAPVIVGLLGRYLVDPTFGLYTNWLQAVGIDIDPLGSPVTAFIAVALMDVWEWTPLITLITLAGLSGVNPSVLEAAALDGAGRTRTLFHIIFPSISNVLLVAFLIRSMDAVRYFDIITITTNGGPADATKIVPLRLYETAFRFFDLGYAAAIGLMMLAVTIAMAKVFVRLLDRKGLAQ
ncbi:carbohydrate ABC transporter permease [Desertihabitans aurantiacus]|uniref:carbohydrate ABC transporter permease n=1 Tax=Desertihabitans aurantiacus TaxID=2282477 RepID=UPI0018E56EC1|nr:sugar ABC transporter permease [Desertihabitans aurantiacus]